MVSLRSSIFGIATGVFTTTGVVSAQEIPLENEALCKPFHLAAITCNNEIGEPVAIFEECVGIETTEILAIDSLTGEFRYAAIDQIMIDEFWATEQEISDSIEHSRKNQASPEEIGILEFAKRELQEANLTCGLFN
jgi:hypothetical protein